MGVVVDGLDSLFLPNAIFTLQCVLRSLNNRKFIYMIGIKQDFPYMRERDKRQAVEEGNLGFAEIMKD